MLCITEIRSRKYIEIILLILCNKRISYYLLLIRLILPLNSILILINHCYHRA